MVAPPARRRLSACGAESCDDGLNCLRYFRVGHEILHIALISATPNGAALSRRPTSAGVGQPPSSRSARAPGSASTLAHLDDSSYRSKSFVDRFAVGEHLCDVGIEHDHVRALRIPPGVFAADTATKVIVCAHLSSFDAALLRNPSARLDLPVAR